MPDLRFISYLKTLQHDDWDKMATSQWTIKDVVAHMIGWERSDVDVIKKSWETKTPPWWKTKDEDDAFNAKWVAYYKNYSPAQLIGEWEMWQGKVNEEINKIGAQNLKNHPELFDWLFEGLDDNRSNGKESHYKHHFNQIKKALGSNE